jgi:hypothetical protein
MNFLTIADEMVKAAHAVTLPSTEDAGSPIVRAHGVRASASRLFNEQDEPRTHIEPWMAEAFGALVRSAVTDAPFALMSCYMNGAPAAVIAYVQENGTHSHVLPLFMAVQPGMKFTPHEDDAPDD